MIENSIRLDKWLWAARFYKTRPLATQAVNGGKVQMNGNRVKPGRAVTVGDQLRIQRNGFVFEITVLGINNKRRPAVEAQQLYQESDDSRAQREQLREAHKISAQAMPCTERRPDKHQRRHIVRFKRKQS